MPYVSGKAIETRLLYEVMGSELVERTLSEVKRPIGEWSCTDSYRDAEDEWINVYQNLGIPVTFELKINHKGEISVARERPTFTWEFPPYGALAKHMDWHGMDWGCWIDNIMFPAVEPRDFQFGVAAERIESDLRHRIPVETMVTVLHFQPVRSPRSEDKIYLEIEDLMSRLGQSVSATKEQLNYVVANGNTEYVIKVMTGLGFVYNRNWTRPAGHVDFSHSS